MSTSAVSSTPSYQPPSAANPMQQNFEALSKAIQSGNLSAAQQAYATLTQNAPAQGASGSQNNPFQQALASIGTALQSGDISGAQSAMQSLKSHHKHGPHGPAQGPAGSNNTAAAPASTGIATQSMASSSVIDVSA